MSRTILLPLAAAVALVTSACEPTAPSPAADSPGASPPVVTSAAPAAPAPGASAMALETTAHLTQVRPDEVCMMNNRHMKTAQIPVVVEGRTYFGCCAMCKDKLNNDPSSRVAVDPVSGKSVDKSMAIIGTRPNGSTLYFENLETFRAYDPTRSAQASVPGPSGATTTSSTAAAAHGPATAPTTARLPATGAGAPPSPPAVPKPPTATPPAATPPAPPPRHPAEHLGH